MKRSIIISLFLVVAISFYVLNLKKTASNNHGEFSDEKIVTKKESATINKPQENQETDTQVSSPSKKVMKSIAPEEVLSKEKNEPIDFEKRDEAGNTVIMQILDSDDYERAYDLIKKGVNLKARNKEGLSVTSFAALTGDFKLYKQIAELTGEVSPKLYANKTVLSLAAIEGNMEMVQYLLNQEKIEIDHQDNLGQSPLFLAVLGENTEVVKLLIKKGANPNLQNKEGESPKDLAFNSNLEELIRLFEKIDS